MAPIQNAQHARSLIYAPLKQTQTQNYHMVYVRNVLTRPWDGSRITLQKERLDTIVFTIDINALFS